MKMKLMMYVLCAVASSLMGMDEIEDYLRSLPDTVTITVKNNIMPTESPAGLPVKRKSADTFPNEYARFDMSDPILSVYDSNGVKLVQLEFNEETKITIPIFYQLIIEKPYYDLKVIHNTPQVILQLVGNKIGTGSSIAAIFEEKVTNNTKLIIHGIQTPPVSCRQPGFDIWSSKLMVPNFSSEEENSNEEDEYIWWYEKSSEEN